MHHPLLRTWRVFRAAVLAGATGLALLASAIAVAVMRFDACGASRPAAADPMCRLGAHLLLGAYAALAVALVLGALSLTLLWRARRRHRRG